MSFCIWSDNTGLTVFKMVQLVLKIKVRQTLLKTIFVFYLPQLCGGLANFFFTQCIISRQFEIKQEPVHYIINVMISVLL